MRQRYIPVFYSVYTVNDVIFTLTSETEAERSSDFQFGFDYIIIQDIDVGENVRFAVYILKNDSLITA